MRKLFLLSVMGAILITPGLRAAFDSTGTSTVSVAVGAEASIQVNTATTTMTSADTLFSNYTGTTSLTYKVRTTQSTGAGTITLEAAEFSPANGPTVDSGVLTYNCTVASPGTACSSGQVASTSSQTSVATFGAGASSGDSGNSASTAWTLVNKPSYRTGTYTSTVTYTISAT